MKGYILGAATALLAMIAGLVACVVIGLITGLICRAIVVGWHAAWSL